MATSPLTTKDSCVSLLKLAADEAENLRAFIDPYAYQPETSYCAHLWFRVKMAFQSVFGKTLTPWAQAKQIIVNKLETRAKELDKQFVWSDDLYINTNEVADRMLEAFREDFERCKGANPGCVVTVEMITPKKPHLFKLDSWALYCSTHDAFQEDVE